MESLVIENIRACFVEKADKSDPLREIAIIAIRADRDGTPLEFVGRGERDSNNELYATMIEKAVVSLFGKVMAEI